MEVSPARTELSARPTSLSLLARRLMPGISSARMAPAPDSSGAQSPAPAIPDAPVAASPTDATPTSSVAARRLEKFAEAVQVKRPSPIIAEPPRQKPAARRPTVPHRNSRIAAQQMGHNPASKRGEVLLMKKMGVQPPNAPVSSAAKRSYESIFKGNMSLTQAAAFDELFPAVQTRAGRSQWITRPLFPGTFAASTRERGETM